MNDQNNILNGLTPNLKQASRHLHVLDKAARVFTFQVFDDNGDRKDPSLAKTLRGTLDALAPVLTRYQQRGAGVFVTINTTKGPRRKKADITAYRAIWREADEPGLAPLPLQPHLVIESSPGHAHEYLIIEHNTDVEKGDRIMQTMVDVHGSCSGAKDRARVLRLAGFFHLKNPATPHLVKILSESTAEPYSMDTITAAIPPKATVAPTQPRASYKPKRYDGATGTPYGIKALSNILNDLANAPSGTRNTGLNKAAYQCAQLSTGGELNEAYARQELAQVAHAIGQKETETRLTIDSGWSAGRTKPRRAPERPSVVNRTIPFPVSQHQKMSKNRNSATIVRPPRRPVGQAADPAGGVWVVVNDKLDASLIFQAAGDIVGVVVVDSPSAIPDAAAVVLLDQAAQILVAIDSVPAGAKAWSWWKDRFAASDRWVTPGAKTPGEFHKAGGNIRKWILAGLAPGLRIRVPPPREEKRPGSDLQPTPSIGYETRKAQKAAQRFW